MTGNEQAVRSPQSPPGEAVAGPRVAIGHEWLISYAGSERGVGELLETFPDAALLTTLLRSEALPAPFARAEPSFLQRLPGGTGHHEWLLPFMPLSWKARPPIDDVDAVIASSHACANAIRIAPG